MSKFQNNKRENVKEQSLTYLGGKKCLRCGISSLHFAAYDFHHYKSGKEGNLSKMFTTENWTTIQKELDKCIILCANCHRETHAFGIKYDVGGIEVGSGRVWWGMVRRVMEGSGKVGTYET